MSKIAAGCFILCLPLVSCEKNEQRQRISWRRVSFTVDLTLDNKLESIYSYKVYTRGGLINAGEYLDTPGVLVFNNGDPMNLGMPFVAYDIRCPYEDRQDATVSVPNNNYEVICPVCKSKYDLLNFGHPVEGPAKDRLQDYCIGWSGASLKRLSVHNCN